MQGSIGWSCPLKSCGFFNQACFSSSRQASIGCIAESMVAREKTFRPETISQCLESHPSVPFGWALQRLGPAFTLLVPMSLSYRFPPSTLEISLRREDRSEAGDVRH